MEIDTTKEILTPNDIASIMRIGKGKSYELIKSGVFPVICIGKTFRIPAEQFFKWLKLQPNQ